MDVVYLRYAGSSDVSRPDWPMRDIDRAEIAHLAETQHTSVEEIVKRAVATGMFTAVSDEDATNKPADEKSLAGMTKVELREIADELKLDLAPRATNAEIADAIEAARKRSAEEQAAADVAANAIKLSAHENEGEQAAAERLAALSDEDLMAVAAQYELSPNDLGRDGIVAAILAKAATEGDFAVVAPGETGTTTGVTTGKPV